jgi:type IV pilus assembly protein PilE
VRTRQSGMTLVELMVVAAIVAILAAIAYPSYRAQVLRSHRTEAKVALMNTAQQLERCFTRFQAFDAVGCAIVFPMTSENGLYVISAPALAATAYTLQATPQAGQADDTACLNLTLTDANVRNASGPNGPACW